jgi:hypothetical protein
MHTLQTVNIKHPPYTRSPYDTSTVHYTETSSHKHHTHTVDEYIDLVSTVPHLRDTSRVDSVTNALWMCWCIWCSKSGRRVSALYALFVYWMRAGGAWSGCNFRVLVCLELGVSANDWKWYISRVTQPHTLNVLTRLILWPGYALTTLSSSVLYGIPYCLATRVTLSWLLLLLMNCPTTATACVNRCSRSRCEESTLRFIVVCGGYWIHDC